MKQKFLLVHDNGEGLDILDSIFVSNKDAAKNYFFDVKSWAKGEVLSETELLEISQNECELNGLENQTPEC